MRKSFKYRIYPHQISEIEDGADAGLVKMGLQSNPGIPKRLMGARRQNGHQNSIRTTSSLRGRQKDLN